MTGASFMTLRAAAMAALLLGAVLVLGCGKESEVEQSGGPEPTSSAGEETPPPEGSAPRTPSVELTACALRAPEPGGGIGLEPATEKEIGAGGAEPTGISGTGDGYPGYGTGGRVGGYRRRPGNARLELGTPIVAGGLPQEVVRRVLRQHSARFRYCYEKALVTRPALKGEVVASFVVDPKGSVTNVSVKGIHSEVDSCVTAALRGMGFPAPKDGAIVKVRAPIAFSVVTPEPVRTDLEPKEERETGAQPRPNPDAQPPMPDMAALVVALRAELQPVRACYERALETEPELAGALHLDLSIAADGTVVEARPSAAPPSATGGGLDACASAAMQGLKLPDWKAGARKVTCTFEMSREIDDARASRPLDSDARE